MPNLPPGSHRVNISINLISDDYRINMPGETFRDIVSTALNHDIQQVVSNLEVAYHLHPIGDAGGGDLEVSVTIDYDIRGLDNINLQAARNANAEAIWRNTHIQWFVEPVVDNTDDYDDTQVQQPNEPGRLTLYSAAAKLLGFLPVVNVEKLAEDKRCCPVCKEHFSAADKPILIKCKHVIGRACVEQWILSGHNSCPLCRATIFEPAR